MFEAASYLKPGPGDLIDILLAAALMYAGLAWLRRSQAALIAVGIALASVLYGIAAVFDLALTTGLFYGFFGVMGVALVVLFQDELRGAFEELAAHVLGRRDDYRPRLQTSEILVASLVALASRRIGALVVVPGIQQIERHLHGGQRLRGDLSIELLDSLFDPHSGGHDGAVVIEDGVVARFGVHLPLSKNLSQIAGGGTRHSAALGLSERTDALCLVVSEERGTISAAYAGALHEVRSPESLATAIQRFHRERHARARHSPQLVSWVTRRPVERLGAVALAAALWVFFVAGSRPMERVLWVPVEVAHLPAGMTLSRVDPPTVGLTATGPLRSFVFVRADDLALRVDAAGVDISGGRAIGASLPVSVEDVRGPEHIHVRRLHREHVEIELAPQTAARAGSPEAR